MVLLDVMTALYTTSLTDTPAWFDYSLLIFSRTNIVTLDVNVEHEHIAEAPTKVRTCVCMV